MLTPVKMPRLGESVAEGTIGSWLKNEGDWVEKDESLAEIITDKINAELPSPIAGRLTKILVKVDETVPVGADIAMIEENADVSASPPAQAAPGPDAAPVKNPEQAATPVIEQSQGIALAATFLKDGYKVVVYDPMAMEAARAVLGGKAVTAETAEACVRRAHGTLGFGGAATEAACIRARRVCGEAGASVLGPRTCMGPARLLRHRSRASQSRTCGKPSRAGAAATTRGRLGAADVRRPA